MADETRKIKQLYISIKSTLNSILRPAHAQEVTQIIYSRCVPTTIISSLASLLLLHKANTAFENNNDQDDGDDEDDEDDEDDFFSKNGHDEIEKCFLAVTVEHKDNWRIMPTDFRDDMDLIHENQFQWPSKRSLGNSFNYFWQQYETNLKTNLNTHGETHIEHYMRLRTYQLNLENHQNGNPIVYDGTDVRNIMKDTFKDQDWTNGDAERQMKKHQLRQELNAVGFPDNANLKEYIKLYWFRSIKPFIAIQREIESFLLERGDEIEQWQRFTKDPKNNEKPLGRRPPTVTNFTVIPICDFHLKHIKIDIADCYRLTAKFDGIPKFINPKTGRTNQLPITYFTSKKLSIEEKTGRMYELFNFLFDVDKIRRNENGEKIFSGQIVTDSVAASVVYKRRNRSIFFTMLMCIKTMFLNLDFENIIGIDPGDKTWLAGVRRDVQSGVEVSKENRFEKCSQIQKIDLFFFFFFYR